MPRRFIALTSIAAGTAIAVTVVLATPALAKGTTQASITGPGLARPVTVSATAGSEALPEQGDALSTLADQTGLFTLLFGPNIGDTRMPGKPSRLRTPPAAPTLGPRYTLTYTVPGITPAPGQASDQIRQYLYPRAAGGPLIYTPPGQQGFGQPLQASGWSRGAPQLTATLSRLGVPANASLPSASSPAASVSAAPAPAAGPTPNDTTPAWVIATIVSAAAIAIGGTALFLRRRPRPAADQPMTDRPATQETSGEPQREPAAHPERKVLAGLSSSSRAGKMTCRRSRASDRSAAHHCGHPPCPVTTSHADPHARSARRRLPKPGAAARRRRGGGAGSRPRPSAPTATIAVPPGLPLAQVGNC